MRVEIDLPNPNGLLRAGMYGCASIGLDSHSSGLKVPVTSVVDRSGKGDGSVRVVRDGRIHRQTVELGADDGSSVEVVSGLAPDDEVVLKAGTALEEGMPVVVDVGG
jgi:multidrug efflux pump subunit AcrA (membrane-fusion protein)